MWIQQIVLQYFHQTLFANCKNKFNIHTHHNPDEFVKLSSVKLIYWQIHQTLVPLIFHCLWYLSLFSISSEKIFCSMVKSSYIISTCIAVEDGVKVVSWLSFKKPYALLLLNRLNWSFLEFWLPRNATYLLIISLACKMVILAGYRWLPPVPTEDHMST